MGRHVLPLEVQRLVEEHFETSTDVDVLLFAYRQKDGCVDARGVAAALRIHPEQAERALGRMAASGLLRPERTGYRYAPDPPELAGAVEALAGLHPSYRVAIVSLIFSATGRPRRR